MAPPAPPEDPYGSGLIAELYEREYRGASVDVAWFGRHARPGPLLVLGSGTGRVARAFVGERPVTGLDRSSAMIDVARRLAPAGEWVVGDMTDFERRGFSEIWIPNASFAFLPDRRARAACLRCCRRALAAGGELVLDLPLPIPELWAHPVAAEAEAWRGEFDGQIAVRTRETRRQAVTSRLDLTDRYYLDGEIRAISSFSLHMFTVDEVQWMLEANGFGVDRLSGDYADRPVGEGAVRILARAVPLS